MRSLACIAGVAGAFALAALAAFAAPGQPDAGFGSGGKVLTDVGGADYAASVALAPGGGLVAAGGSGDDVALARYDSAGRLDPAFGEDGSVVTDLGSDDDAAAALVVQPDGKVVVAGQRSGDLALLRYAADGTLDPTFDGDGVVVSDLGGRERGFGLIRTRPGGSSPSASRLTG